MRVEVTQYDKRQSLRDEWFAKEPQDSSMGTFIREADEVKVFETFGGDLPVFSKPTESRYVKRLGDRSDNRTAGCCKDYYFAPVCP